MIRPRCTTMNAAVRPPGVANAASTARRSLTVSTSAGVRSSSNPRRGSSSRIGRTISGSYIGTFRLRILSSLLEKRAQCGAKVGCAPAYGVDIGPEPETVLET